MYVHEPGTRTPTQRAQESRLGYILIQRFQLHVNRGSRRPCMVKLGNGIKILPFQFRGWSSILLTLSSSHSASPFISTLSLFLSPSLSLLFHLTSRPHACIHAWGSFHSRRYAAHHHRVSQWAEIFTNEISTSTSFSSTAHGHWPDSTSTHSHLKPISFLTWHRRNIHHGSHWRTSDPYLQTSSRSVTNNVDGGVNIPTTSSANFVDGRDGIEEEANMAICLSLRNSSSGFMLAACPDLISTSALASSSEVCLCCSNSLIKLLTAVWDPMEVTSSKS